jgi:hypothetical protein
MIQFPKIDQKHYALAGGLDQMTPAIAVQPGRATGAQNYEPEISGGYRRIDGYERFDGHASPSSASYWLLPAAHITATVGMTVSGSLSGASGRVLAVLSGALVLGRVTGDFLVSESLAAGRGSVTGLAHQNGAVLPSDHADYLLLAANDLRTDIGKVPGSGPLRGVWVYNDAVYAFRDSADGSQGLIHKATPTGWVQIALGWEVQFSGATGQIRAGDTIADAASSPTATATVIIPVLRTGSWTASGAGTLIVSEPTAAFASGAGLFVAGTPKATAFAGSSAITRAPGGMVECVNYNFTGSTATTKIYGADGVNPAFEFDGTHYVPIRTGMAQDTPSHVIGHKFYLFLSFLGSVQLSGIGNPYAWTTVLGAQEIAVGQPVTGFMPAAGSAVGDSALAIFTRGQAHILYGASSASFKLVTSKWDMGFAAHTAQAVSNDIYGLTARGLQAFTTTLDYGDFDYASISHQIQPLMTAKRGMETVSTTLHAKNQYRLYFSDGTGIVVGLTGQKVSGILPLDYGRAVRCICTAELSSGQEVCYFGSDDGYVYRDGTGTSFDGAPIEAWMRLHFNALSSPMTRKRMRRAVLEVLIESYSEVNFSYDLGYGSPAVQPSAPIADQKLAGAGGYWDSFTWDRFNWDAQAVLTPSITLEGTEKNISFIFYSKRAQDAAHVLQGVTFLSTPRRNER